MNWDEEKDDLKGWMKDLPQAELPDSFTQHLMAQIQQEAAPVPVRTWPSLFPKWLALGLASLLGALLGWTLLSPSSSPSSSGSLKPLEQGLNAVDGVLANIQLPSLLVLAAAALLGIFAIDAWLGRRSMQK
jgi:hypothetical protein